jgi:hypothetical protein
MAKKASRRRDPEDIEQSLAALVNRVYRNSAQFLKTDAETALTFSSIALQTDNPDKRERNRRNARKGYDTILRLASQTRLSSDDEKFLSEKLGRLKSELKQLGEEL